MIVNKIMLFIAGLSLAMIFISYNITSAGEEKAFLVDKSLCTRMLRFGKEAYQIGKYLDAKEYFRKAIQADVSSHVAWVYYDKTVIFALAEKVEKNVKLILPDVSDRLEVGTGELPPAPAQPLKDTDFIIVDDDEGC